MIIVEGSTVALGAPESSFIVCSISFSFPLTFAVRSALDFVYEASKLSYRTSRVPTPSACSLASVSGSEGADSALYTTPKHTLGVTFVLGCTTGSPSLSVCFGSLYNLVEELVVFLGLFFT